MTDSTASAAYQRQRGRCERRWLGRCIWLSPGAELDAWESTSDPRVRLRKSWTMVVVVTSDALSTSGGIDHTMHETYLYLSEGKRVTLLLFFW